MIHILFHMQSTLSYIFIGIVLAFITTAICLKLFMNKLPRDGGRKYAVNGSLSKGKPRGAGIIFIIVFCIMSFLFLPYSKEMFLYLILVLCAMISGYLDDRSSTPWGEYLKGIIDLVIAVSTAYTYWNHHGGTIHIQCLQQTVVIPTYLFLCLATILIWVSINVTNCSDGVDGLCGTLSLVTLVSITVFLQKMCPSNPSIYFILLFTSCLLAYLWFNANPSRLIMGDAGSRAIGLFISIAILNTKCPLLFLPVAFLLLIDGGLGLVKVSLLRFLKIRIFSNTITPIHDELRKHRSWSDTQVVFRLAIIQIMISFTYLFCIIKI